MTSARIAQSWERYLLTAGRTAYDLFCEYYGSYDHSILSQSQDTARHKPGDDRKEIN
jgi:hypothetical protein